MKPEEITSILTELFGTNAVEIPTPNSWQVETPQLRLLVILSLDKSWLRLLVPIASAQEAQPYLKQLLEANFELTQEVRYALNQEFLWGVFQHSYENLTVEYFKNAIAQLVSLREKSLSECFNQLIEQRIRQIIKAAKLQGQTLEATLRTIKRFYEEGMLGGLEQDSEEREQFLKAWQYQLERLWQEVEL
ncbi:MAG: hypothetical protein AB4426_23005 [Xenococcaceae cyanobacterium]